MVIENGGAVVIKRVSSVPVVRFSPVKRCIYCGTTDPSPEKKFTKEHILPLSLGGTYELPESSCWRCQRIINEQVEIPITRDHWGDARERLKLPTRGKSEPRTHVAAKAEDGSPLLIPIDDFPHYIPGYRFGTARLISGSSAEQRREIHILSEPDERVDACLARHPTWNREYGFIARPDAFARLMAKIAYGFVAATSGTEWFTETITPIIRGIEPDYTTHVGGDLDGYAWTGDPAGIPSFHVRMIDGRALIIMMVAFVREDPLSRFHVVVGECEADIAPRQVTFRPLPGPRPPLSVSIPRRNEGGETIHRASPKPQPEGGPTILAGLPGGPSLPEG